MTDDQQRPDDATPAADTPADTPTARARPTAPGAAAARRARQLGGTRRPLPAPRPATDDAPAGDADTPEPTATAAAAGTTARTGPRAAASGATAPKSSVGKAASRPRPRPRPTAPRATATADPTPAATDDTAGPTRVGRATLVASLALTVLLVAVGVVFLVRTLTATPEISQRETDRALAAAKSDVALLTSYGYQTIDADAAKAAEVITGQFKDQYLQAIATVVKPQLPSTQTVAVGQVDTAGLVSASENGRQVVALVYCQQSVTNKAQTTPRIDALQIRVTMQQVGGEWLVAKLEQLGNNA